MKPFAAALAILALVLGLALVFHNSSGSNAHPTLSEMEADLVCLTCHEPIDESNSPFAQQVKAQLHRQIAAGWTKDQIEHYYVVTEGLGPGVLAVPESHGFDLLAWLLPFAVIVLGCGAAGLAARTWLANRDEADASPGAPAGPALPRSLELRVDEELARFDA